ncbi:MAG: type III-A CRISPR-associated protein Csm2 [Desulfovibrio sp.]|nr:type III-A CRISPR-associated protein Csm2 [Desulfovibrio sp.]
METFGRNLERQGLTTSQIRQVFTRCKSIEARGIEKYKREFLMLKPYLAYAAKRHGTGVNALRGVLDIAINQVLQGPDDVEARFKNFCSLFEAILAYHRAAGGK